MLEKAGGGVLDTLSCPRTLCTLRVPTLFRRSGYEGRKLLRPCWTDLFEHPAGQLDVWYFSLMNKRLLRSFEFFNILFSLQPLSHLRETRGGLRR